MHYTRRGLGPVQTFRVGLPVLGCLDSFKWEEKPLQILSVWAPNPLS